MAKYYKLIRGLIFIAIVLIAVALLNPFSLNQAQNIAPAIPDFSLADNDRIMILAPHPDDEALACAGVIQTALKMKLPVKVVFFTNGDFNELSFMVYNRRPVLGRTGVEKMGMVRHDEAVTADESLGLTKDDLIFLGYPDFGTISILESHWGNAPPYRSLLTRAETVPYSTAYSPGAPYKGEEILADLESVISDFHPTKIFLSHPADYHPDHQSLYLFTRIALWDLKITPEPVLYPYLVHFKKWPQPKGYHPDVPMIPPENALKNVSWTALPLTPDERASKHIAIKDHKSQYESGPNSMLSYVRDHELFGDFKDIPLRSGSASLPVSDIPISETPSPPELLTDTEKAAFLGFEERTVRIVDKNLEISIRFSRPLAGNVGISVYFFGYRNDRAFADMPKIHIRFGAVSHRILDRNNRIPTDSIKVTRSSKQITMRIPLELLGNPEHVLTGAKSYLSNVPLDWLSWRALDLQP